VEAASVPEEAPERKPFAAFLREQRRGALHSELSEKFAELVAACQTYEKGGTLTLQIKVKPSKDGETVQISDQLTLKVPEADRSPSVFFTDGRGNVSRSNPRQDELPLREVSAPAAAEPRDIKQAGGESA
jgi:hypothetical protein